MCQSFLFTLAIFGTFFFFFPEAFFYLEQKYNKIKNEGWRCAPSGGWSACSASKEALSSNPRTIKKIKMHLRIDSASDLTLSNSKENFIN
jgi:hypothetical protein